jgi:hypothetical protein
MKFFVVFTYGIFAWVKLIKGELIYTENFYTILNYKGNLLIEAIVRLKSNKYRSTDLYDKDRELVNLVNETRRLLRRIYYYT